MKKKLYIILFLCLPALTSIAQEDDLLKMLDSGAAPFTPVTATFKSTRVINGHSVELVAPKHLDFRISHRFGFLNDGAYGFYGLDRATLRLGFEYGINRRFMVGLGRSNIDKAYDAFLKVKLMKQNTGGDRQFPVTVVFFASALAKTAKSANPAIDDDFLNKMYYTMQLLIARKFNSNLSLQLSPTFIHRNLVTANDDKNDVLAVGAGGRYKFTRSSSFNVEYFWVPEGYLVSQVNDKNVRNSLSVGIDIETGGHVFQLHLTNSLGMNENSFITETNGRWSRGDISFGFNISRMFSFAKVAGNKKGANPTPPATDPNSPIPPAE